MIYFFTVIILKTCIFKYSVLFWTHTLLDKALRVLQFPNHLSNIIHGNMIFSSNFLKRWSFQKGPRRDMIIVLLSGEMVFLSQKHDILSLGRKWEMTFLKKYMEIWYFLRTRIGVTNVASRPPAKKNQGWSYPTKIHLKVIDVLDWHPRKSSSNSLYFHGDLYRRFHVLLSSEKKNRKLNI